MTRKAVLIAASIALALGSSAALAAGKKHGHGIAASTPADPRVEYQSKAKGGFEKWCDLNSSCNGWDQYMQGVAANKKFAPASSMVIPHL
jgi:hypothetical protein